MIRFLGMMVLSVFAAFVIFVGGLYLASELGGEVVVLRSFDPDGRGYDTRVWIVDYDGRGYLRGGPDSDWVGRVMRNPEVELDRGGQKVRFRVVPTKRVREPINHLMAEKYEIADVLIGLTGDRTQDIPLRLEPVGL